MKRSATGALVTKVFEPSSIQLPSRSTAVVCSASALEPESGSVMPVAPITLPSDTLSVSVGADGTVSVTQPGQAEAAEVGQLELTNFVNPTGLQAIGENLYLESASSGAPTTGTPGLNGLGTIQQGSLESSNVNVVEELVNMIESQRAYEMNSKAISTNDQMMQYLNNNL